MAVKKSCEACRNLQEYAPEFVLNGVTENVENSLKNNTGFNPSSGHDDCQDLNDANDCLVGNMEDEVDAYEVCEWKEFMPDFIHNLWTVLKSIISAICGLWKHTEKNECTIKALTNGFTMHIGETPTGGSYVVAGKGVSFLKDDDEGGTADISLLYIGGGLARVQGTLRFSTEDFTDEASCYNYDSNGTNPSTSKNRKGNAIWNNTAAVTVSGETYHPIKMLSETELIYEIRLKKSAFPGLRSLVSGIGAPTGGGNYQVNLVVYGAGSAAGGQHYHSSPTHTVPEGWIYVQARMISIGYLIANLNHHYSPRGFIGVRLNSSDLPCDDTPSPDPEPDTESELISE